jgi:hypothetical protein
MRTVVIAFPCPDCGSSEAALPVRPSAGSILRCLKCQRQHGELGAIREDLQSRARRQAAERAREVYRVSRKDRR